MSSIQEKVKRLIAKAKETGDADLLDLAMELLDQPTPQPPPPSLENAAEQQEFSMKKVSSRSVQGGQANKFVDDGSEHKDVETPSVQLTERRRNPFKKVEQTCSTCGKKVEVHPQFAREFFKCDRCMRR